MDLSMRNPVGLLFLRGDKMNNYPKRILSIPQQLQSYTDAGMTISSTQQATEALKSIGYYSVTGKVKGAKIGK